MKVGLFINTQFPEGESVAARIPELVEQVRDELVPDMWLAPADGHAKVYIVEHAESLGEAAASAFLKTLEEPPPYAIFILATTEKHKILPTILSRCQVFDFKRITTHDVVAHLQSIAVKESMVAQEAALHVIAQKSEGAMRDALSMLDRIASFTNGMLTYSNTMEHLNLLDADFYFRLTDSLLSQDVAGTLLQLDQALAKGFEGDVIIGGLAEHFRNLLLCKDPRMAKLLDVPNDFRQLYNEKANQSPPSFILSALNVINESELQYKQATNKRLHVELCLVRLCFLLQSIKGGAPAIAEGTNSPGEKKNNSTVSAPVAAAPKTENNYNPAPVAVAVVSEQPIERPQPTPAPQPEPVATPVMQQTPAPPPQPVPQPATAPKTAPAGRRLSMGMLSDIDEEVNKANANQGAAEKILTQEAAEQLFEDYKLVLQAAMKNVIHAQFNLMKLEVYPPDEVKVISPSELTDTYAREQRTQLIDFYRDKAKMIVRITTEIREDEAVKASQNTMVLSKSEIYDAMTAKNPNLGKLKDALGMNLEY